MLLSKRVVATVHCARARFNPFETGGFLIGVRRGLHIEVTGLTHQAEGDIATRTSFERVGVAHRERIHAAWRTSGEIETLVGDWHSHPRGPRSPSSIDRSAWRTLACSVRQPVLGLIEHGAATPSLYLATELRAPFATELVLCEEGLEHLAFAESADGA